MIRVIHTPFKNLFSGSEWDYVILSLVRSLSKDEIDPQPSLHWLREHLGFVTDEHQINVGLTRARKGLCIIGMCFIVSKFFFLISFPFVSSFLLHFRKSEFKISCEYLGHSQPIFVFYTLGPFNYEKIALIRKIAFLYKLSVF